MTKQFLLASDFDQTLSFNDSGAVLSELIGFHGFDNKVKGLSEMNLVQQGAELSYLILHDPDFRKVRRERLSSRRSRASFRRIISSVRASAITTPRAKWIPSFALRPDGGKSRCSRNCARTSASATIASFIWETAAPIFP